jgi:hypothetical protein
MVLFLSFSCLMSNLEIKTFSLIFQNEEVQSQFIMPLYAKFSNGPQKVFIFDFQGFKYFLCSVYHSIDKYFKKEDSKFGSFKLNLGTHFQQIYQVLG